MVGSKKIIFAVVFTVSLQFLPARTPVAQEAMDTGSVNRVSAGTYFGIGDSSRYDVTFRDARLREVLQFLAWIADLNIIIPEGLDAPVNLSFKDITITDALNAIIRSNSLEYTIEGKVIRIGKGDQFRESGEDLKTETFRLQYAAAKDLVEKIKTLLSSRGSVVEDDRTNSIVVRELPTNIENVRRFIKDIDIKDAQVLIEAKILEATRKFSRSLGIQWDATRGADGSNFRVAGVTAVGQADSTRNLSVNLPATTPTSGILIGSLFKGMNLEFQITAAEEKGDVYVISDPSIVTSNGKSANIRSGSTLLIQGQSTVNIGTTTGGTSQLGSGIQEIKTGVELTVTPQITVNDFVKLEIKAVTSTPDYAHQIQGVPVVLDNTASTVVLVKDGETTVIGGLSRYADTLSKKSVPYLSRIPVFGNLFRSKNRIRENTELMVFIKPSVIRGEGREPAQVRVKELEARRAAMEIEPVIDPIGDAQKKEASRERKIERENARRGNKYVR